MIYGQDKDRDKDKIRQLIEMMNDLDELELVEDEDECEEEAEAYVKLLKPSDFEIRYDGDDFQAGIQDSSYNSGLFTGYVNAGMTREQAYELILTQISIKAQSEIQSEVNKSQQKISSIQIDEELM